MDRKQIEQARARLLEMKQAAEDMTTSLGLAKEATYDVMSMMYNEAPSSLVIQHSTVLSTETLKDRIFHLSERYISSQLKAQLPTFRTLWERVKTLPVEALSKGMHQQAPSTGLGFAGSQALMPVISFISWAVINQSTLIAGSPEQVKEAMVKEAQKRGFSRVQSYALARFLQQHLLQL